jgi:hypothetical protein
VELDKKALKDDCRGAIGRVTVEEDKRRIRMFLASFDVFYDDRAA